MRAIVPPDEGSYSYAGMGYANPMTNVIPAAERLIWWWVECFSPLRSLSRLLSAYCWVRGTI